MKKILFIGTAVAIAMGFASCQKENVTEKQASERLIKETFSACFEQTATKTTISDDAATVNWSADDKIYYFSKDGGAVRSFTIPAAGASASLTLEREEGDTYYNLVYAGNTEPTFTTKTGTSMVFDGVKSAQDGTFRSANISVGHTTPGGSGITFKPVTALVKFTTARTDIKTIVLTGGNGEKVAGNISVDPTASSPVATLSGTGENSITVTIATPAAGTYYIGVIPGTYSNGLRMVLKNGAGEAIGVVIASKSTNLSAGDAMINYGTVDTHISSSLLTGKISVGASKLVQFTRGNLYWDGAAWQLEENQSDYPTAWSSTHVGHLYWTKDAAYSYAETYSDGTCAASDIPFFAESKGGLTVEGTDGLFALSSAEWTYLFNTRTVNGGTGEGKSYRRATVNSIYGLIIYPDSYTAQTAATTYSSAEWATMESAGCVFLPIAGTRANSTTIKEVNQWGVYWSSTPKEDEIDKAYRLTFSNSYFKVDNFGRSNGYSVRLVKDCTPTYTEGSYSGPAIRIGPTWWAPVNCGYDATNAPTGLFYQWGRMYGQSNTKTMTDADFITQAESMAAGNTEANKDKFYKGSACWFSGNTVSDTWSSEYDPCPVGWRVPNATELSAIIATTKEWTSTGGPSSNQTGYKFGTSPNQVFFPVAGYRKYLDGSINDATTRGYYWSSSPSTVATFAMCLSFDGGSASMSNSRRANGYSVRCVQE